MQTMTIIASNWLSIRYPGIQVRSSGYDRTPDYQYREEMMSKPCGLRYQRDVWQSVDCPTCYAVAGLACEWDDYREPGGAHHEARIRVYVQTTERPVIGTPAKDEA